MAIGTPLQLGDFNQFAQLLYDPISREPMVDAVTLDCGHTVSQRTADIFIQKKTCPIDHAQISSSVPNLNTRAFVQFFLATHPTSIPGSPKSLGNSAENTEKLMSIVADMFSELKATREELREVKEVLQDFKRESEKIRAREQPLQAKERFALHLPSYHLGLEELKQYFGTELQLGLYTDIKNILLWPCPIWPDKEGLSGLTEVIRICPNLTTLSLTWCRHLEDEDLQAIALCFPNQEGDKHWKMSFLLHLDLGNCCRMGNMGLATIGQNCPNLQELIVKGCTQITDAGIQILCCNVGGSHNCPQLQTINLSGTKITDQAIGYFTRYCPELRSLDLSNCESITDKGVVSLAQTYRQNLLTLNLQGCKNITDVSIIEITKNCSALQTLVLKECKQVTLTCVHLLTRHCRNLQTIEISWENYGMRSIADFQQIWPDLTTLNLTAYTELTDDHLAYYIRYSAGITVNNLNLNGCTQVTDASIKTIMENCPDLQTILIEDTKITYSGVQKLKTHFPSLSSLCHCPPGSFGKDKWETYFADVGEEPPLPPNIYKILASRCPFDREKTVSETHFLVLVPAFVNGSPLTLDLLGYLVQNPKNGGFKTRFSENSRRWEAHFTQPCQKSHWVLMYCDDIPDSHDKERNVVLKRYKDYETPTLLEASVCMFMDYVTQQRGKRFRKEHLSVPCMESYFVMSQGTQLPYYAVFGNSYSQFSINYSDNYEGRYWKGGGVPLRRF